MPRRPLVVVPFAIWLAACGQAPRATHAGSSGPALAVQTISVALEPVPVAYEAIGTVKARTTATISARMTAAVRQVDVQTGDHVQEGQTLVVLDARDLDTSVHRAEAQSEEIRSAIPEADSAIAAARANEDLAQATFHRMRELYEKKSVSNQEFDEVSARLKAAQASVDMARAKRAQLDAQLNQAAQELSSAEIARSYSIISAPFAGVVTAKSAEPGNLATPGAPLLTIEREGAFRLEASVDESRLPSIRAGQNAAVTLEGPARTLNGRVSEIVPAVDAASRTAIVKIDLPAIAGLRSGMFGRAVFSLGARQAIAIPAGSVVEKGQLQSVFVADGGVARVQLLTLGQRQQNRVEVLSGLNPGDRIIFPIPPGLTDGSKVEVQP